MDTIGLIQESAKHSTTEQHMAHSRAPDDQLKLQLCQRHSASCSTSVTHKLPMNLLLCVPGELCRRVGLAVSKGEDSCELRAADLGVFIDLRVVERLAERCHLRFTVQIAEAVRHC